MALCVPWAPSSPTAAFAPRACRRSTCHIISGKANRGDGHTLCGEDPAAYLRRTDKKGEYEVSAQPGARVR